MSDETTAPKHRGVPTTRLSIPGYVAVVGGVLGFVGVAAGAFGAHALRGQISARDLEIWGTAAHYQQVHAVLLVVVGLAGAHRWSRPLTVAAVTLGGGIVVFAGTLQSIALGGPRWLGAITPIGGLLLMCGWIAIAVHGLHSARRLRAGPTGTGPDDRASS